MAATINSATITTLADDSGAADFITKDPTLTIGGSFTASNTSAGTIGIWLTGAGFTAGGQLVGSFTTGAKSGSWSFDLTKSTVAAAQSLADGTYTITTTDGVSSISSPLSTKQLVEDHTAPTVTIGTDDNALKIGDVAHLTFTLSESSTDFTSSDVSVSGGSLSNFSGSGKNYTADFTPTANSTATATANVAGDAFHDTADNGNTAATQLTMSVDTVAPTVTIGTDDNALKIGDVAHLTFTLTESSSDFTSDDVAVSGGSLSNFSGSGKNYTADFTPTANSTATATVDVAGDAFHDAADNSNTAATQLTMSVDTVAPAVAITGVSIDTGASDSDGITSDQTLTVNGTAEAGATVNVYEDGTLIGTVTADASGDWSVADPNTLADGTTYTFTATATDDAGNTSDPAVFQATIDTTPPAAGVLTIDPLIDSSEVGSVSVSVTGVEPGGSAKVTFTATGIGPVTYDVAPETVYDLSAFSTTTGVGRLVTATLVVYDAAGNQTSSSPVSIVVATQPTLLLKFDQYNSIDPSEWQGNAAYTSVSVRDLPAKFASLTGDDFDAMTANGIASIGASVGSLSLTVAQYTSLDALGILGTAVLADTAAHIEDMTGTEFAGMAAKNITILQPTSGSLALTVDQYRNLGGVLLPANLSSVIDDSTENISGLTPTEIGGLYSGRVSQLVSDTYLALDVAQELKLGRTTVSAPSAVLLDTGANIATLTFKQLPSLASHGFTAIDASDGSLTLNVAKLQALGSVALTALDTVTLQDSWTNIAALDLSTLAGLNVDFVYVTNAAFSITTTQYAALGSTKLTGPAVATLTGTSGELTSPGLDLSALKDNGISAIDATDNVLSLSLNQYRSLNGLQLTAADLVTVIGDGTDVSNMTKAEIAGLATARVDVLDSSTDSVSFQLEQFNALGTTLLSAEDALTLNGTGGADSISFTKQPFAVGPGNVAADKINGDAGVDTLTLQGNYGHVEFASDTITNVEKLALNGAFAYDIVEHNGNVGANQTLTVLATNLAAGGSAKFDGSAETDGSFSFSSGRAGTTNTFIGGNMADTFTGAAGTSTFTGGGGADTITLAAGAETVRYNNAVESNSAGYDFVKTFDAAADVFSLWKTVTFDSTVASGVLKAASFDTNLGAALTSTNFQADHAAVFYASSGDLKGNYFLVVNDASAGYQGGNELVVKLGGTNPNLTGGNFTH